MYLVLLCTGLGATSSLEVFHILEKKEGKGGVLSIYHPVLNSQEASTKGLCVALGECSVSDPVFSWG